MMVLLALVMIFIGTLPVSGQGAVELPSRWFWQSSVLSLDEAGRLEQVESILRRVLMDNESERGRYRIENRR
ncbi:MAG: hypothetical protein JXR40_10570 [Pontiellaceae bacterium]|nr:hypothetical protein [Pontiellaceae bacterium]